MAVPERKEENYTNLGKFLKDLADMPSKGEIPQPTVTSQISVGQLEQYRQAAEQTGFKVTTLATEGQKVTFWTTPKSEYSIKNHDEKVPNTVTVQPGHMAISINPPEGERNFAPFWKAYDALTPPPTGQRG